MFLSLATFACLAAGTALQELLQDGALLPPPTPAEARLEEWHAYLDGKSAQPPAFTGSKSTPRQPTLALRLLAGGRFGDDDIAPLEELYTGGVEAGFYGPDPHLVIDLGLIYSRDEDDLGSGASRVSLTGEAFELYSGPRWVEPWGPSTSFYLGFGGSLLRGEAEIENSNGSISVDDTVFGVYARAGIEVSLSKASRFGLDVRHIFSENSSFGGSENLELDSTVVALALSFDL
jgi:hypothetical protein